MKYRLKANDNLWEIAKRYKIKIDTIVGANAYLKSLTKTKPGQELILISKKGVLHKIKDQETLDGIAGQYGVTKEKLEADNALEKGFKPGEYIFISDAPPVDLTEEMNARKICICYGFCGINLTIPIRIDHYIYNRRK